MELESIAQAYFDNDWAEYPHTLAQHVSKGKWKPYPYLVLISEMIAGAVIAGGGRFIFNLPPRHGKSELISKYTPAWFLNLFPEKDVILASYEADFASRWGRQVRNILSERRLMDTELAQDSSAAYRFNLKQGGQMITAGIGGAITGQGGSLIIVDDPVKNWKDAKSETMQRTTIDWFNSTLYTRAEADATIVILQTRWDENDLAGYLLSEHQDPWVHINFPAIAKDKDNIGREIGDALCPDRFPIEKLRQIKSVSPSKIWNALYDGDPLPEGGNTFQRSGIRFYKKKDLTDLLAPKENENLHKRWDFLTFSWDFTFEDEGDWNVGQLWGCKNDHHYLISQFRFKEKFIGQLKNFRSFTNEFPFFTEILIEKKANGAALLDVVNQDYSAIVEVSPVESKEVRADSVTGLWESGRVHLPDPEEEPWVNDDFLPEILKFPSSKTKDQVDTMTQYLRHMINNRDLVPRDIIPDQSHRDDDD